MYGALPPGAWWEVANGAEPVIEPYGQEAGDAAVEAAQDGDIELLDVNFAYPARKELSGKELVLWALQVSTDWGWKQGMFAGQREEL
jgi:hypothetical protein